MSEISIDCRFRSSHLLFFFNSQPTTPPKNLFLQTISADDVVNALADSGFEEIAAPLRDEAEARRLAAKEAAAEKERDKAVAAAAAAATETK